MSEAMGPIPRVFRPMTRAFQNLQLRQALVPMDKVATLPETIVAPENWWLEDYFPFGIPSFQVLC